MFFTYLFKLSPCGDSMQMQILCETIELVYLLPAQDADKHTERRQGDSFNNYVQNVQNKGYIAVLRSH